jgi:hypothetical protein
MPLNLYKRKTLGRNLTHNEIDWNWDQIEAALNPAVEIVRFTTVEGQDTYSDPAIDGMTDALVVYGQMILDEGDPLVSQQYTVSGEDITIAPGGTVEGGKRLLIIKGV